MLNEEEIEFERLLQDKRHKELKKALLSISVILEKSSSNNTVAQSISKQSEVISNFLSLLPAELSQKEVSESMGKVGENILSGLTQLKTEIEILNKPKQWEFTVHRERNNLIDTITAKQI